MAGALSLALDNFLPVLAALGLSQVAVWWFGCARGWGSLTLLCGAFAAYALDRLIDAPSARRRPAFLRILPGLVVSGGLMVTALAHDRRHLALAALLSLVAGAYVPLKRVLPKNLLAAGGWAAAVVWLPCATPPTLRMGAPLALCVWLVVMANTLLCDALDVIPDRAQGVRGLGPWLGGPWASWLGAAFALSGGALSCILGPWPLALAAGPLVLAGLTPALSPAATPRRAWLDLAVALPGLVVALMPQP
jgi:hypothetical protein